MRCGVYVRVSTDNQRDNGYSISLFIIAVKHQNLWYKYINKPKKKSIQKI